MPRNATNLVRGLLGLVPGGEFMFKQLQKSDALKAAFDWVNEKVAELGLSWKAIRGAFNKAWKSLSVKDLLNPANAFSRIIGIFKPIISGLIKFAKAILKKMAEFVFEGTCRVLGLDPKPIMGFLRKAGEAFKDITDPANNPRPPNRKNPFGFLKSDLISSTQYTIIFKGLPRLSAPPAGCPGGLR